MSNESGHESGQMTCEGFAGQLASYLEDELAESARGELDAHAASCASCGALVADLDAIRHEAAALPALEPSHDLWSGIAARLDAPVVSLAAARRARVAPRRAWVRPSIAAAALILVTAGVTHVLTRASYAPAVAVPASGQRPALVAQLPDSQTGRQNMQQAPTSNAPDAAGSATATATASASNGRAVPRASTRLASTSTGSGVPAVRLVSAEPVMKETQPVYDREIGKLRAIVTERRSQLDPRTIAVLEQSIAVIDSAIAQSRAALAKDPASGFLATQLNHSLEKKVELLRTAALLPSRT
jgi:hypothetical protein